MAFLDNSGDIILDAVLTDTGRYRLAKGDGSFKIEKFALGDDEIDYSLYNKNHPSGSAYYDLDILQTPILEALTDNASALKSRIISIDQTDLLFLPVMKLHKNESADDGGPLFDELQCFVVCADASTEKLFINTDGSPARGVFFSSQRSVTNNNRIAIHQGLDTTQISPLQSLPAELEETVFMLELDNRLGSLYPNGEGPELERSYIDDDQIATYLMSIQKNGTNIKKIRTTSVAGNTDVISSIRGPRGNSLIVSIAANMDLMTSTFLFEQFGSIMDNYVAPNGETHDFYYIDTSLRITGANTGYKIDVPIRFIKLKD